MTLKEIIENTGGVAALAKKLGVTRQSIYVWLDKKSVPRSATIQKLNSLSNGQFDVTCLY